MLARSWTFRFEIVDEKAGEIFPLLTSNKAFTFLSGVQLGEVDRAGEPRRPPHEHGGG